MDEALAAYQRALAHYERCIAAKPETRPTSDHYAALALAGRARVFYERHEEEQAVGELLASLRAQAGGRGQPRRAQPLAADTSRTLRARLVSLRRDDLVARLDARWRRSRRAAAAAGLRARHARHRRGAAPAAASAG
jgi:hypothetical protein